jgi:ribonuclease HII
MKKARTLLGIDEAGRGCVLGPMVFGAFLSTDEVEQQLRAEGVRDSKRLSKKKRALLAQRFQDAASDLEKPGAWGRHETVSIPPSRLDSGSLNEIGKEVVVELTLRFRPDVLILDAPVPPRGLPKYREQILARLAQAGFDISKLELVAENGADDTFPCCSAASILAKTFRDRELALLEDAVGRSIGSGYPSDPRTVSFLRELWARDRAWPPFVRTKWETARRIVAENSQGRLL